MNEQMPRGPLSGKRALVTGASGGVGMAIARALAGTGADLSLSAIGANALEQTAEEIKRELGLMSKHTRQILRTGLRQMLWRYRVMM